MFTVVKNSKMIFPEASTWQNFEMAQYPKFLTRVFQTDTVLAVVFDIAYSFLLLLF